MAHDKSVQDQKSPEGITIFDIDLPDTDFSFLDDSPRVNCPECNRSAKYYCYKCHINVGPLKEQVPSINLPLPLDIIKHPRENDGKSTGLHAKLLAPNSTTILSYPVPPNKYDAPERCLLLFPSHRAIPMSEIFENGQQNSYDRIVVIEGTWYQAHQMVRDTPVLSKMQHVTLSKPYHTVFWRFQQTDPTHLATIEAIYYIYRDYISASHSSKDQLSKSEKNSKSSVENLLFYYRFFYSLIQHNYSEGPARQQGRTFTTRHKPDYIKGLSSNSPSTS